MILIDGDSCPRLQQTEKIAKEYNIECHIFCNTHSYLDSDYSTIHIVGDGPDAADFAIIKMCNPNDIVITSDSGLAAMVLSRGAFAVSYKGFEFTKSNIDSYLNSRYIRKYESRKRKTQNVHGLKQPYHSKSNYSETLRYVIRKSQRGDANGR